MKIILYLFFSIIVTSCGGGSSGEDSIKEVIFSESNRGYLTSNDSIGIVGTDEELNINILTIVPVINNSISTLTVSSGYLPDQFPSIPSTRSNWIIPIVNIGPPKCYEYPSLNIEYSDNSSRVENDGGFLLGSSFIVNGKEKFRCLSTNETGYIVGVETSDHASNIYITSIELLSVTEETPTEMPFVTWSPESYYYFNDTIHVTAYRTTGTENRKNYFASYILFDDSDNPIYIGWILSNINSDIIPSLFIQFEDNFFNFRGRSNKVEVFIQCSSFDC